MLETLKVLELPMPQASEQTHQHRGTVMMNSTEESDLASLTLLKQVWQQTALMYSLAETGLPDE